MRNLLAALLCLLAAPALAQAVPDRTPEELVGYIYQQYVGKKGIDTFDFNWSAKPLVDRLFEPALARAIVAAGRSEELVIDYDPFVSAQDFKLKSYTLRTERKEATRARIAADVVNFDRKVTVTYDLVAGKAGWRIRDVAGSDGTSLRKLLKLR